jgi:hypothetical protein
MALPHAAHAGRRDRQAAPLERFRDPHLAPGGLLSRHRDNRLLDLRRRAVLHNRLPAQKRYPGGFRAPKPYLRYVPQPQG